jgi:hypothetical protein
MSLYSYTQLWQEYEAACSTAAQHFESWAIALHRSEIVLRH